MPKTGRILILSLALHALAAGCAPRAPRPAPERRVPPTPVKRDVRVDPARQEAARQTLLDAAAHSDELIRAHAIEAIKDSMGSAGRTPIVRAFADPAPLVRFAAAMAAGELRLDGLHKLLAQLVQDQNPHVQIGALFARHRLGDTSLSVALEDALASPDPGVRANAAVALGRLGETSAVKVLRPLLRDGSIEVRLQAAEAMWRLGSEEGLEYVVAATLSRNPANQMVAILALAGPRDGRVIEHVRPALRSDWLEVSLVAARALGMLGSDEGYGLAMQATKSGEWRQRYLAALALSAIGRADAQDTLAALLKDPEPDVRVAAAGALLTVR